MTRRARPGPAAAADSRPRRGAALFRERPIVPLLVLLAILVVVYELVSARASSTPTGPGVIMRAAVPLAILAGCQTLTMLTGGIDLSVGAVASMAGFLVATLVDGHGVWPSAILVALIAALLAGAVTGIGVGVFRVHPLIMILGMSLVVLGLANVWQIMMVQTGAGVPPSCCGRSAPTARRARARQPHRVRAAGGAHPVRPAPDRLRPPALRDRRQPDRGAPVRRPRLAGPRRPVRHLGAAWRRSPGSSSPA